MQLPHAVQVVLDIVMEEQPLGINLDSEEEVELDIDMLSKAALWRLQAYVEQQACKVRQPQGAGTPQPAGGPGEAEAAAGGRHFEDKAPQHQAPPSASQPASANGNKSPAESGGQPSGQNTQTSTWLVG